MKNRINQIYVSNDNILQRLSDLMTRIMNIFLIFRMTTPHTIAF